MEIIEENKFEDEKLIDDRKYRDYIIEKIEEILKELEEMENFNDLKALNDINYKLKKHILDNIYTIKINPENVYDSYMHNNSIYKSIILKKERCIFNGDVIKIEQNKEDTNDIFIVLTIQILGKENDVLLNIKNIKIKGCLTIWENLNDVTKSILVKNILTKLNLIKKSDNVNETILREIDITLSNFVLDNIYRVKIPDTLYNSIIDGVRNIAITKNNNLGNGTIVELESTKSVYKNKRFKIVKKNKIEGNQILITIKEYK